MDEKHIQTLIEVEQRSKSNTHRIDELEKETKNNNDLALSVKELTVEIKYMRKDYQELAKKHTEEVRAIDTRLSQVENKPVNDWERLKWLVITRNSISNSRICNGENRHVKEG